MQNFNKKKLIFYISIGVFCFFLFLVLNAYIFKLKWVLIGFFQELLTIPTILSQPFLLYFAIKFWRTDNFSMNTYSFWASLILVITIIFTFGSFIVAKV